MPHSEYLPHELGTAVIEPAGSFEAGAHQSFTLTYTAGFYGIDDTGSLKICHRFASDMGKPQFDDPAAPDYVTVEASNGAVLDVRYDVKQNLRPWDKTLYIKIVRGYLREGDRIIVRFGDPRGGSPGMRLQTFCEDPFEFRVLVDAFATYDYVVLPDSPRIAIVPGPPETWHAVVPTLRRVGEPFRLSLKGEDHWGNPSDKCDATLALRASRPVDGLPDRIRLEPGAFAARIEDLRVHEPGDLAIEVLDAHGSTIAVSNPLRVVAAAERLHYWADIHGQSDETIGTNSARDYFAFARDRAFLDVTGHQGNDFQITDAFWRDLNELCRTFTEPGRFVVLPGYEWSGNTGLGGDRNVFFRDEHRPIHRSSHVLVPELWQVETRAPSVENLYDALEDEDCILVPHVGGRYADIRRALDPRFEHAVEIHSAWGTFEWFLADALERGARVGIVANADGHKGRPGASYPGASTFGSYGGLTCLLMPELTRDAAFEAYRKRRHYATTGCRMVLDVRARWTSEAELFDTDPRLGATPTGRGREATMGELVRTDDAAATLVVDALGGAPVERVELRNGTETVETVRPFDAHDLGRRIRVIWEGSEYRGRGRQTVWDGRAHLAGNGFEGARPINFYNRDKRFEQTAPGTLEWNGLTTGGFEGFDAWLAERDAGTLTIETPLVHCEIPVAEIGLEDRVFEAGGLGRRLRVFRLPDENPHRAVTFERRVALHADRDNALHVRVTQEDGHWIWSSPIYLFR